MKILFVSPSYKPAYIYGGPTVSVSELAESLVSIGHSVTVYTTTANGKGELEVKSAEPQTINGVTVCYFKRQTGDHTHVSFGLWKKLWSTITSFDVIHLQSWWSILILVAAAICRAKNRRYIVSPRGMLSWYSFKNQHSLAKRIIHQTVGKVLLRSSYLHATTNLEWNDCMHINNSWKGFVLPNLVRFPDANFASNDPRKVDDVVVFGFLSRIDQKKGLELLFHSLSKINFQYHLKIAGTGEESYISSLKEMAVQLGIDSKLSWCGWKSGEEKYQFLQSIDVFVLTSYNENFANTVIESLLSSTPVFLSKGVGLAQYVTAEGLGWTCETNVIAIAGELKIIFKERHKIGTIREVASATVRRDFNKTTLAHQYINAYVANS